MQRARYVQLLHVDVGLVEAVEQHQPVGAGAVELAGEVGEGGEERRQFDGDRNFQACFTSRTISMVWRSTSLPLVSSRSRA